MANFTDKYTGRRVRGGPEVLKAATQPFFGRVSVVSDTIGHSAVVSTSIINSSSLIFCMVQAQSDIKSFQNVPFCVATISPGGYFKLQAIGSSTNVGSYVLMYEIKNPL